MDMRGFNTHQRAIHAEIITAESAAGVIGAQYDVSEMRVAVFCPVNKIQAKLVGKDPLDTFRETVCQNLLGQLIKPVNFNGRCHVNKRKRLMFSSGYTHIHTNIKLTESISAT